MFTKKKDANPKLQYAIDIVLEQMALVDSRSDEYAKMTEQLTKLYKLKEMETPKPVSADTLAIIAGNLAGIVLIIGHERAHIVTSKALGFVMKLR